MFPSAGQTGENEGGACPQCGLFNKADSYFCYNCRYPLRTGQAVISGQNGKVHAAEAALSASSNGKTVPGGFGQPLALMPLTMEDTRGRIGHVAMPWGMVGLSWVLLVLAYALAVYALDIKEVIFQVFAFLMALLAAVIGAALLRERALLARISGGLLLAAFLVMLVVGIRAAL